MKVDSLEELYVEELKDLYDGEKQMTKALPKMAQACASPQLKAAFEEHLVITQKQVERLDKIFKKLGKSPTGKKCKAMAGLISEGEDIMKEVVDPAVRDAALIGAAQKVEHYEIAGYGTARTIATLLGDTSAVRLLQQTLNEEGKTDKQLTKLAETSVNVKAAGAQP